MPGFTWLTDAIGNAITSTNPLPITGSTTVKASTTGTQTSVASSATDVTILAANVNRLGAAVFNESTATLYLLLAAGTSSATNYSVQLTANALFELPYGYTGIIKGVWASAVGSARVTEFT